MSDVRSPSEALQSLPMEVFKMHQEQMLNNLVCPSLSWVVRQTSPGSLSAWVIMWSHVLMAYCWWEESRCFQSKKHPVLHVTIENKVWEHEKRSEPQWDSVSAKSESSHRRFWAGKFWGDSRLCARQKLMSFSFWSCKSERCALMLIKLNQRIEDKDWNQWKCVNALLKFRNTPKFFFFLSCNTRLWGNFM